MRRFERLSMKEMSLIDNMTLDVRVAFSVALFDRSFMDGSAVPTASHVLLVQLSQLLRTRFTACLILTVQDVKRRSVVRMSGGSLLRLFQSEYFDAHLHMHYLLRMEQSGVQDYLVNELYKMTDDDVDFYLPQLSQDKTPELFENAMAMLSLCEAAMVNSTVAVGKTDEAGDGPPRVQRMLRRTDRGL
eukprot:s5132_g1.t2